jgi:hypothetical protein
MELSGITRQVPSLYLTIIHPLSVSGKLTGTLSGFITCVKPAPFGLLCGWRGVLILRQQRGGPRGCSPLPSPAPATADEETRPCRMLEVNVHGGVLPLGDGRPQVEGAARGDPAIPAAGVRRPAASERGRGRGGGVRGARACFLQGLPYPFEYEGNGGVLLFAVILQDAAAAHFPLSPFCRRG